MDTNKPKFRFDHTRLVEGFEFYELIYGRLVKFKVTKPFTLTPIDGNKHYLEWEAQGEGLDWKGPTQFGVTEYLEHYGPKIYFQEDLVEHNGQLFLAR